MVRKKVQLSIAIILLALPGLGQVPDTDDFTLQDVVNEINPPNNTLVDCFSNSVSDGFDPNYEGNHDRLYNFRNYEHYTITEYTYTLRNNNHEDKAMYAEGTSWNSVQGAGSANTILDYDLKVGVEETPVSHFEITRSFVTYETGDLPSGANIVDAYIEFRVTDENEDINPHTIKIYESYHGTSIELSDFDKIYWSNVIFGAGHSMRYEGDLLIMKKSSVNIFFDESYINTSGPTQMCFAHTTDEQNNAPGSGNNDYFMFWLTGEAVTGDYMRTPRLVVKVKE